MEVLGKLGIDLYQLVAQIINFVLLLWLLNKFVYKPLLKKLDSEKADRETLASGLQKLEEQKKDLIAREQESEEKAKKRSEEIISEAERIAEDVKKSTATEAEYAKHALLSQAQEQVKTQNETIRQDEKKKIQELARKNLESIFQTMEVKGALGALQKKYLDLMVGEVNTLSISNPQNTTKVVVEYGIASDEADISRIKFALEKKLGHDVTIESKERSELIAGYRLEFEGYQLQHSLIEDITYATHNETP